MRWFLKGLVEWVPPGNAKLGYARKTCKLKSPARGGPSSPMEPSTMEGISSRLAGVEDLYFPRSFLDGESPSPSPSLRKSALLDLLSRDAPIFLERYGSELTAEELSAFEAMEGDYEIGWHLRRLRRARAPPTAEEVRGRAAVVKNRRRAYMDELLRGGEYFSEDSMRVREPYLHHEYVGRFQDPAGRGRSRPGEKWSEMLMRMAEEVELAGKIRGEQRRLGVDRSEWVGGGGGEEEEEHEEESEDDDGREKPKEEDVSGEGTNGGLEDRSAPTRSADFAEERLSAEELEDQLEQFTSIMQQKFVSGEDTAYIDYAKIDNNERLDDYWVKEANHDAEERYFDED